MFASGPVIGVKPSDEYQFRLFATPVGPYFKGGAKPLTLCVSDFDRAAPHGTGHVKAGLNYAMSLYASVTAHAAGYDENVFLDPGTRTYVEETGGANFLFITKDGEVVTPKSDSILPSITRRSLVHVAEHYLGLKVTERPVKLAELSDFAWMRWDLLPGSCMKPLPASRWAPPGRLRAGSGRLYRGLPRHFQAHPKQNQE